MKTVVTERAPRTSIDNMLKQCLEIAPIIGRRQKKLIVLYQTLIGSYFVSIRKASHLIVVSFSLNVSNSTGCAGALIV
jgi:hypothetical protein